MRFRKSTLSFLLTVSLLLSLSCPALAQMTVENIQESDESIEETVPSDTYVPLEEQAIEEQAIEEQALEKETIEEELLEEQPLEDIHQPISVTVEVYNNGNWEAMSGFSVENEIIDLSSEEYEDTKIVGYLLNEQGSMDLQGYENSTFRLTYQFNEVPFVPGFLTTLDFDTQFAPNGWTYDHEAHSLELYVKPALYQEDDHSYWSIFVEIYQTGGLIDEALSGSTIASVNAKSIHTQLGTYLADNQLGVGSLFSSDAGNTVGNVKWYLPIHLLNSRHIYRASDIALYELNPETKEKVSVRDYAYKDHIVNGILEGILIETELNLPRALWITKNIEAYADDNLAIIKSLLKDEMYFDQPNVDTAAIDTATDIPDLLKKLKDPYTTYWTPEEYEFYKNAYSGNLVGIGVFTINVPNGLFIESLVPDSPAYQAGIKVGDLITEVDGNSLAELSFEEKFSLIRGLENSRISLTIARAEAQQPIVFELIRKSINIPDASAVTVNDHTILLRIRSFTDDLMEDINEVLSPLYQENMNLIVDLRGNSGGNVFAAFDLLQSTFADGTPLIRQETKSRVNPPVIYGAAGNNDAFHRIIVLGDEHTASAAEITTVSLKDNGAAFLGSKTYGKAVSQTFYMLPDGSMMKYTDGKFTGPKNTEYNHIGILPNVNLANIPNDQWLKLAEMLLSSPTEFTPSVGDLRVTIDDQDYDINSTWFGSKANKTTAKLLLPLISAPDTLNIYNGTHFETKTLKEITKIYNLNEDDKDSNSDSDKHSHSNPINTPVATTNPSDNTVHLPVKVSVQKQADSTEVSVAEVSKTDVQAKLAENRDIKNFVILVSSANGAVKMKVPADLVTMVYNNNENSSFTLQTEGASYTVPTTLLRSSVVSLQKNGIVLDSTHTTFEVQAIEKRDISVKQGKIVSKVFDFSMAVTSGESSIKLDSFGKEFVSRTLDLNQQVDLEKAIGVVVNSDGSISPVPTQFIAINGKQVAVLKRNGNSTYAVIKIQQPVTLTDIQGSWAKSHIQQLADKLILTGYPDRTYKPSHKLTRSEYLVMLCRMLGYTPNLLGQSPYSDVNDDDWFSGYLHSAAQTGLINGYEDGTFRGNKTISREEAVVVIVHALELLKAYSSGTSTSTPFTDTKEISSFAKKEIEKAHNLGIIEGKESGQFDPKGQLTRAEAAALLSQLVKTFETSTN